MLKAGSREIQMKNWTHILNGEGNVELEHIARARDGVSNIQCHQIRCR